MRQQLGESWKGCGEPSVGDTTSTAYRLGRSSQIRQSVTPSRGHELGSPIRYIGGRYETLFSAIEMSMKKTPEVKGSKLPTILPTRPRCRGRTDKVLTAGVPQPSAPSPSLSAEIQRSGVYVRMWVSITAWPPVVIVQPACCMRLRACMHRLARCS